MLVGPCLHATAQLCRAPGHACKEPRGPLYASIASTSSLEYSGLRASILQDTHSTVRWCGGNAGLHGWCLPATWRAACTLRCSLARGGRSR